MCLHAMDGYATAETELSKLDEKEKEKSFIEDRNKKIVEMYSQGISKAKLSEIFKVSRRTVYNAIKFSEASDKEN